MVIKLNKSLLGDDWFKSFCSFRLGPEAFLDKRKLTRDAFCLDVLKDLCGDHVENQCKIHLLLLLQEHSTLLINDSDLLEQVIGSLINLCSILATKADKRLLKSQALVAITTILLSHNVNSETSRLLAKVKALLTDIIYNSSEDSTVVSSACKCLEELEEFYPGIMESEISNISVACEQETLPTFQSYTLLLSLCVKNLATKLQINKISDQGEREISKEDIPVSPIVSQLFEMLPYLSYISMHRILRDLIYVVKLTPELPPTTFKLHLQNLMMSSDVPLFHLAFELLDAFGYDLFSLQDEKFLYKHLIKMSTHPCLTSSHRLLFLDWLKSCITHSQSTYFSTFSHKPDLRQLLPAPFDGPLTQEKKSFVLASSLPQNTDESVASEFFNESISGLVKCSSLSGGTKAAPSLFRTLFIHYSSHPSEAIHKYMYKLLTGIMKTSPHLTPYALSFLQCMKSQSNMSNFQVQVLGHLVEHILSIPLKQLYCNLDCYLSILETASQESASICRPRAILRLLQKLLTNSELKFKNVWSTGNDLLSVCRSFLKYHDVQTFYYDLAEVLCLITQSLDDADVKDRAKIYYSMLTTLSKLKIQTIFNLHSSEKDTKSALSSFVTGSDAFQFASGIQKLSKPVLQLIRVEQDKEDFVDDDKYLSSFQDILEKYWSFSTSNKTTVKLPFLLKHCNDIENTFLDLYSIVISTHSDPPSKEISVIEIPVLKKSKTSDEIIFLAITPLEPCPVTLHFKAEFTCDNGFSYTCRPPSVDLNFEDLFMPLPVPESNALSSNSWRQQLFEALWENFKQELQSGNEFTYCQSSFCLNIRKDEFPSIAEQKWKAFIVTRSATLDYSIAMFLPPKNHLLMKISIINEKPFANIIVDNNTTLPWITLYLQNL